MLAAAPSCAHAGSGSVITEPGKRLTGTWAQDISVPGAWFVTSTRVTLDITYDYGPVAYFENTPAATTQLAGALKNGPKDSMIPSCMVTFRRTR